MSTSDKDFGPRIVSELGNSIWVQTRVMNEQISILNDIVQLLIEALQEEKRSSCLGMAEVPPIANT